MGYLVLGVLLLLMVFWVAAMVDVGRTPDVALIKVGSNKAMMMTLVVLTGWIGATYWFALMRPRVQRLGAGGRQAAVGPPS
jgi:hypothetical protein